MKAKPTNPALRMNRALAEYRKAHREAAEHGIAAESPDALEVAIMWSFDENGETNAQKFSDNAAEIENRTLQLREKIEEEEREAAYAKDVPPEYVADIFKDNIELAERKKKEAARSRKYSRAGKKGARVRNSQRPKDTERDKIVEEAKRKLRERDDKGLDQSDNAIFANVANRHIGENGKPIVSAGTIKKAIQRSKGEKRGRHNRNRQ